MALTSRGEPPSSYSRFHGTRPNDGKRIFALSQRFANCFGVERWALSLRQDASLRSDFFQALDNCPRFNRRRSYRFDRARHRVFVHRTSRLPDRMRAGRSHKAPIHAVPHRGQASGSVYRGIEIGLPFIGTLRVTAPRCSHMFLGRTHHSLDRPRTIFGRNLSQDASNLLSGCIPRAD